MLQVTPLASKALPLILISLHLSLHVRNTLSRRLQGRRSLGIRAEQVGQTVGFPNRRLERRRKGLRWQTAGFLRT